MYKLEFNKFQKKCIVTTITEGYPNTHLVVRDKQNLAYLDKDFPENLRRSIESYLDKPLPYKIDGTKLTTDKVTINLNMKKHIIETSTGKSISFSNIQSYRDIQAFVDKLLGTEKEDVKDLFYYCIFLYHKIKG